MRRVDDLDVTLAPVSDTADLARLGEGRRGFRGTIVAVRADGAEAAGGLSANELERRLLEMGFVEGARVEILHEGLIRRDPIAVRVDDMRVALRRADARGVLVRCETVLAAE